MNREIFNNTGHAMAAIAVSTTLLFSHGHNHEQIPQAPSAEGINILAMAPVPKNFSLQEGQTVTVQELQNTPIELSIISPSQDQVPADTDERVMASRYTEGFNPNLRLPDRPWNDFWARFVYSRFASDPEVRDLATVAVLNAQCESGLNPNSDHVNNDAVRSHDKGINSLNDIHGLGDSAFDPEVNVSFAIKLVKIAKGFKKDWVYCSQRVQTFLTTGQ